MNKTSTAILAAALALAIVPAKASGQTETDPLLAGIDEAAERAAILELIDRAFDAVASDDPDHWRPLLSDQARELSFRLDKEGALVMRESATADMFEQMQPGGEPRYIERWTGAPTVQIRGPIANVWGPYDFWIDGAFSHCGVDTVHLAKIDGAWKIAHWMWTVERQGCVTAGDPAPK